MHVHTSATTATTITTTSASDTDATAATLHDFTIEHVRCVVPPDRAHTTALTLVSGMLPPWPTVVPEPDPINDTLRWFGRRLFAVPFPERSLSSSRARSTNSARHCVEELADADTTCVLDVIVATHITGVAQRKIQLATDVCGSATLSVSDIDEPVRMALRHLDYKTREGQLRMPFAATVAQSPRRALDDLRHAVELPGAHSSDRDVPTITALSAGRLGDRGDHDSYMRFAHFAPDGDDVWKIRPCLVGTDLGRDAHIAEVSDRAHYRMFKARPARTSRCRP